MGWLGWKPWAGCQAFRETGPTAAKGFTFCLEISFKIEFEFELLSNSNITRLNPNKSRKIQFAYFYHNLNLYFYKWVVLVEELGKGLAIWFEN
jgi:hypothetical protein